MKLDYTIKVEYGCMELSDLSVIRLAYFCSLAPYNQRFRIQYRGDYYLSEIRSSGLWDDPELQLNHLSFVYKRGGYIGSKELYQVPFELYLVKTGGSLNCRETGIDYFMDDDADGCFLMKYKARYDLAHWALRDII